MSKGIFIPSTVSPQAAKFLTTMPVKWSALPSPNDLVAWKKYQDIIDSFTRKRQQKVLDRLQPNIKKITLNHIPCYEVYPKDYHPSKHLLIYIHGGGYSLCHANVMLDAAALIAEKTRYKVISIDYTLAPFAKHPQILDEVLKVYSALENQGIDFSQVGLYGDSAGGSLACASILKRRDLGLALPKVVALWSPWTDVTQVGDSFTTLKDAEPCFTYEKHLKPSALAYTTEDKFTHPYVSPVYGDYSQAFPPTLIQGGTKECLLSCFVRLYQALDNGEKEVKLDLYEGMVHIFQIQSPQIPEAQRAINKTATFLKVHMKG